MAFSPKISKRRWVSAVVETVKGTDPGSGYATVLLNAGPTNNPGANFVERNVIDQELGSFGGVTTSKVWGMSYQAELKGGGASSPVPEIGALLQACAATYEASEVVGISSVSGTFELGETVTEATSGATGIVIGVTATALFLSDLTGNFTGSLTVTGRGGR